MGTSLPKNIYFLTPRLPKPLRATHVSKVTLLGEMQPDRFLVSPEHPKCLDYILTAFYGLVFRDQNIFRFKVNPQAVVDQN